MGRSEKEQASSSRTARDRKQRGRCESADDSESSLDMVEVILGTREDKPKKEIGARESNSRQLFLTIDGAGLFDRCCLTEEMMILQYWRVSAATPLLLLRSDFFGID